MLLVFQKCCPSVSEPKHYFIKDVHVKLFGSGGKPTDDEISFQPSSSRGNNSGRLDSRNLLSNWWPALSHSYQFLFFRMCLFVFDLIVAAWKLHVSLVSSSLLCVIHNNDKTQRPNSVLSLIMSGKLHWQKWRQRCLLHSAGQAHFGRQIEQQDRVFLHLTSMFLSPLWWVFLGPAIGI